MSWYYIVAIVIGAIILVHILVVELFNYFYFNKRCDGSVSITYPLPSEFENLNVKKSFIEGYKNNRLSIYEYSDKNAKSHKGVILITHGIGTGHFYILNLIEKLCLAGYVVAAYDAHSSGVSEGKRLGALGSATKDAKCVAKYVDENYQNERVFALGHSWGGYAIANVLHHSKKIEKAIIVAGINSEADFISFVPGTQLICLFMKLYDLIHFGKDGTVTIEKVLKTTDKKVMYVQGTDDMLVSPKTHSLKFKKEFENSPNIEVKIYEGKKHTPFFNLTSEKSQWKNLVKFGFMGGKLVPMEAAYNYREGSIVDEAVLQDFLEFLDK